ncbi:WXG100 family type VII secretion target [Mycobacteroides abscessus]|uniref:WXG100 family type VII secretion target n=1 Tax=Mycobacteroides abscessus TaxID=36809 RepID=UPI001F0A6EA2|nr:WXG100 family type VII secretion target [Mycobacteroides abscessus]
MAEVEQRAEASIAAMDTEVRNLHATFTGGAATAHAQAHEKWARGAEQMREALKGLRSVSPGCSWCSMGWLRCSHTEISQWWRAGQCRGSACSSWWCWNGPGSAP